MTIKQNVYIPLEDGDGFEVAATITRKVPFLKGLILKLKRFFRG